MGLGGHNGCVLIGPRSGSLRAYGLHRQRAGRGLRGGAHDPAGELFERLAEETRAKTTAPQMMVGRIEGEFLASLVRLSGAKRILELGTFTGYSSISMASALPPDGTLVTSTSSRRRPRSRRRYMDESGVGDRIEIRLGPALETIEALDGPFDLVFIDADKPNYKAYYEAVLPQLAENGLDHRRQRALVRAGASRRRRRVNRRSRPSTSTSPDDRGLVSVMLTVRDGMTLVRKRKRGSGDAESRAWPRTEGIEMRLAK